MSEFLKEMFSRTAVVGTAGGLLIIGAVFWAFPRTFRKALAKRSAYVAELRAAGEEEKARQSEADTASMVRQGIRGGRMLVFAGAAVTVAEILLRR